MKASLQCGGRSWSTSPHCSVCGRHPNYKCDICGEQRLDPFRGHFCIAGKHVCLLCADTEEGKKVMNVQEFKVWVNDDGKWHRIDAFKDGNGLITVYIDGELKETREVE